MPISHILAVVLVRNPQYIRGSYLWDANIYRAKQSKVSRSSDLKNIGVAIEINSAPKMIMIDLLLTRPNKWNELKKSTQYVRKKQVPQKNSSKSI